MDLEPIITAIRAAHRERCYGMEARKQADLRLLSFLRTQLGWRRCEKTDTKQLAINKAINERAKAFADGGEDADLARWQSVVDASIAARAPFDEIEATATKTMEGLAEQLPVWELFGKPIRGFGPASLAVIVGEAGDLSIYSNPAKLWKRMGLAVMDGVRQGGLSKNASKEDWIAHGYNRQRRSRMWNIGDALIKGNRDGEYRTLYLARKEYEAARNPEMTPMQAHRRAQRYMEKRLLRSLWQAWRQTICYVKPVAGLSAASPSDQQASVVSQPSVKTPAAATGLPRNATRKVVAGRSYSDSEAIENATPKRLLPRKRRASVLTSPNQGLSGAPIQQAIPDEQPKKLTPAGRQPSQALQPIERAAGANLSRTNGTGGQVTHAPQRSAAAR